MSQKSTFLFIALIAAAGMQGFAADDTETIRPRVRYEKMDNWVEGTLSAIHSNGTLTLRGIESPYAPQYLSYMHYYNSVPEADRNNLLPVLKERYSAALNYKWDAENLHNFALNVAYPEDLKVFNETSRYGAALDSWTFNDNSRISRYSDLEAGERVVIGFDNHNTVGAVYRINPIRQTESKPANTVTVIDSVYGTTITRPYAPNIDPRTGLHVMNLGSNETNHTGSKSGSDSGHIMNSGSNSTNNAPLNPVSPYIAPR